jgi:anaerobic magnesium-protoporphyrin IX monomethyl ester cyclase
MEAKILFTHSYFYRFDSKQWRTQQYYPPYGTIQAAAVMKESGFEVALWDTNLAESPRELEMQLQKEAPKYLVIYDDGFNYLTKMCLTNMREACFEMCEIGKKYGCTIIISSSDSTDHAEKYLEKGADFVLLGEAEITLKELIIHLESSLEDVKNIESIKGIALFKKIQTETQTITNQLVKTPKREILKDLDSLPQPAWELVDMKLYKSYWKKNKGYFSANVATTRGCPYKCNWCAKPIYGNRYNARLPLKVANEMEFLVKRYGVEHFWISDDIFGLKPNWVQEFNEILKEKNLKIRYKIQSRVDLLLKEDTIDALVESGLEEVWVGAESGSQKILDAMDKGTTLSQISEATKILQKKGVKVCFFLQFGYLGETLQDIKSTIEMVKELLPHDIGISVSYPLPNTVFYEKVKTQLKEKQNWKDSNELAIMYDATFQAAYYKCLYQYVHHVFKREKRLRIPQDRNIKHWLSKYYYSFKIWQDVKILKKLEKKVL